MSHIYNFVHACLYGFFFANLNAIKNRHGMWKILYQSWLYSYHPNNFLAFWPRVNEVRGLRNQYVVVVVKMEFLQTCPFSLCFKKFCNQKSCIQKSCIQKSWPRWPHWLKWPRKVLPTYKNLAYKSLAYKSLAYKNLAFKSLIQSSVGRLAWLHISCKILLIF